ncbi:cob(I)yrinic acid a,c-diamide adenosyltransferase [Arhodomonas sp. AD133]|uniref:cob(I)yrinic acid a,c-diamide adenosyltransferase n=1 Tax=Arhodomonas sp. AD133 TaxID=3415009 RepID=UPI003EBAFEF6
MSEEHDREAWQRAQARTKRLVDSRIARATEDRGVVVINTGNGKGKSSSGFGMVARALGHDMRVGVVQFIKGAYSTGEEAFFRRTPEVDYHVMGEGFTWETQDRDRDVAAANTAWERAAAMLADPAYGLVLLDELNVALSKEYVSLEAVLEALAARPTHQNVVITGRYAPEPLIEAADTVTWMKAMKHAFKAGVKAQKGVEL